MKYCFKCKKTKSLEKEFQKNQKVCRQCKAEYSKARYERDKDKILAKARKWKRDNPEKANISRDKWNRENPERKKAIHRKYDHKHRLWKNLVGNIYDMNNRTHLNELKNLRYYKNSYGHFEDVARMIAKHKRSNKTKGAFNGKQKKSGKTQEYSNNEASAYQSIAHREATRRKHIAERIVQCVYSIKNTTDRTIISKFNGKSGTRDCIDRAIEIAEREIPWEVLKNWFSRKELDQIKKDYGPGGSLAYINTNL